MLFKRLLLFLVLVLFASTPMASKDNFPAVIVITHDRTKTLGVTLTKLLDTGYKVDRIIVSHDDPRIESVRSLVSDKFGLHYVVSNSSALPMHTHIQDRITQHVGFALRYVLQRFPNDDMFTVFEDDLEVNPQRYRQYLTDVIPVLRNDNSLFCASTWNDNGFNGIATNLTLTRRTDFFPGMGWTVRRNVVEELVQSWPDSSSESGTFTVWDYWIRNPAQMKNRTCVYPEVPISRHLGNIEGASVGLVDRRLHEDMTWSNISVFTQRFHIETSAGEYGKSLQSRIQQAQIGTNFYQCEVSHKKNRSILFVMDSHVSWYEVTEYFQLWPQLVPGYPQRSSYNGIHEFQWLKRRVILAESMSAIERLGIKIDRVPLVQSSWFDRYLWGSQSARRVRVGDEGASCHDVCEYRAGMTCETSFASGLDSCKYLRAVTNGEFTCSPGSPYMTHDILTSLPGLLKNDGSHTFTVYEPLSSDILDSGMYFMNCNVSHPRVRRICPCRVRHPQYETMKKACPHRNVTAVQVIDLMHRSDVETAESCAKHFVASHESSQSLNLLAYIYYERHKYRQALGILESLPLTKQNVMRLSDVWTSLGNLTGALWAFEEMTKNRYPKSKWDSETWNAYGIVLARKREYKKAAKAFRNAYDGTKKTTPCVRCELGPGSSKGKRSFTT
eukprot:PhF_6_TR36546/c0_g1_i1/m.53904/K00726/MGAT1; alpha-1,3-mannosyl-glycoprotein beta-1,2-N-acetylglucosaminyltransferase